MPLLLPHLSCSSLASFSSALLLLLLLLMLMMDEGWRRRPPFTTSQWQELEQQALVFNYMALGIPIPSQLVLPFKRSRSDPFYLHSSLNFGRRAEEDPEPWRCRRTDGKKWRCSREVSGDSKYCERHRHIGKKQLTKTAEMPLLTGASYISSSSCDRCSNGQMENRGEKKQDRCLVFGADLKLQRRMNVPSENGQVQSPKLQLSCFGDSPDRRNNSWKDSREERAAQLSVPISRQ